jgi:D-sedoheptulose 7-phosphate isomerase
MGSIDTHLRSSAQALRALSEDGAMSTALEALCTRMRSALRAGCKIYVAGNGGSAADAQHFAAELVGRFRTERRSLAAIALTTDSSVLTAIANDYGFEHVFSRQLEGLLHKGDIFLGISTSGTSPNIDRALRLCQRKPTWSVLLTSERCPDGDYGPAHTTIRVPGTDTALVQQAHSVVLHALCASLDEKFIR